MRSSFLLLTLAIASAVNADTVTFSDGTFNSGDWSLNVLGNGTATATQMTSGGNPGAFRQVTDNVDGIAMGAFQFKNGAVYNPSTQGAILSLDYSEDGIILAGSGNFGAGGALMQNGVLYSSPSSFSDTSWTHRSFTNKDQVFFQRFFNQSGPGTPDFSATGGPITFGFWRGAAEGTYSITSGIDNWSVTLHNNSVPEPAGLALAALPAIALIRRRTR